jgi:hypothetical protein
VGRDEYAIWLRTYYQDTDAEFKEWIETDEAENERDDAESGWWCLLDDEAIFAFGEGLDAYNRVLDMIPELAGPSRSDVRVLEGPLVEPSSDEMVKETRAALREDVTAAVDKEATVHNGDNGVFLQLLSTDSWLLVADKEAFETDQLLVLFLDARGNIVRHARIWVDEIYDLRVSYTIGHLESHRLWDENSFAEAGAVPFSSLGDKYKINGEIGRTLYGVEDLVSIPDPNRGDEV